MVGDASARSLSALRSTKGLIPTSRRQRSTRGEPVRTNLAECFGKWDRRAAQSQGSAPGETRRHVLKGGLVEPCGDGRSHGPLRQAMLLVLCRDHEPCPGELGESRSLSESEVVRVEDPGGEPSGHLRHVAKDDVVSAGSREHSEQELRGVLPRRDDHPQVDVHPDPSTRATGTIDVRESRRWPHRGADEAYVWTPRRGSRRSDAVP